MTVQKFRENVVIINLNKLISPPNCVEIVHADFLFDKWTGKMPISIINIFKCFESVFTLHRLEIFKSICDQRSPMSHKTIVEPCSLYMAPT